MYQKLQTDPQRVLKSVDFMARNAKHIQTSPAPLLNEVLAILDACIY